VIAMSEVDFIVLGSGGASLGLSVRLVEKAEVLGGGTADSLGTERALKTIEARYPRSVFTPLGGMVSTLQ
jgi:hypothetical protein